MALHAVNVTVSFLDSAERTSRVTYQLNTKYNDATPNIAAILADVDDLVTALNLLTWSEITGTEVAILWPASSSAANVAANNQVRAFTRVRDTFGNKGSFEVPAWDDAVYDQNSQNILSAAYDTAALGVVIMLRDPDTDNPLSSIDYSQSRTRKSRNIVHD